MYLVLGQVAYADPGASSQNIETVIVTGTRGQAAEVKKDAQVLLDIAPLEQIRSLPDANAAEALQRLPGIQMESDSGAGRFINIRGMDADLNGTTYDGVRLMANNPASPQGGARAVAFDAFPAGILGGIEVIKSLTPELDAEGLGGIVNIQPRHIPTDEDHILDASVGGGVESLRGTGVYKGDITAGKRFFDDKVSVIVSYSYADDRRGIDDIESDGYDLTQPSLALQKEMANIQYRWYEYHRTRQGYGGGITYSPNSTTNLYLRGIHAGYVETAHKHEYVLDSLASSVISTGMYSATTTPTYDLINTKENLGNDLVELGGNTSIGDTVSVDARVSWTQGYDTFPYGIKAEFLAPDTAIAYNNTDPRYPTYNSAISLVDPSIYGFDSGKNGTSNSLDSEWAGVANASFPLEFDDDQGVVKIGGSLRDRVRSYIEANADLNPANTSMSNYVGGKDVIYYSGHYDIGPQPDYGSLLAITQSALTPDLTTYAHDHEKIYAGYAQYSATFGDFDVIGGVRVESTDGAYSVYSDNVDKNGNETFVPFTSNHSYTNLFPDFSVKYQPTDDLQIRLAYSKAIARPGFQQISGSRSVNYNNAQISVTEGNSDLKPTLGDSVDLYASYFMPNDGVLSGGVFYKSFSDYIIQTVALNDTSVPGFVGQPVDLTSYSNVGSAHAEGLELDYSQQLKFLPDPFDGLGFEGNLTYVESRGEIRPGEQHTLPQTSPFAYNAAVSYAYGPLFLKLAASYVSTNLWAVGDDPTTDLYSQPRLRLDFGSTYDITDEVQAYFDVKNLTNTHLEFTQTKSTTFPVQNEFYDQDYLFGVRVKL
jgi:TonB-dependent receptor